MFEFCGVREQPFGADRRVAYLDRTRRDALASLYFGVLSGRNLLGLVAADGLGKTLLLRQLVARLQRDAHIIFLADAPRDSGELLRRMLEGFRIPLPAEGLAAMRDTLWRFATTERENGRRSLVIVDDAHNLDTSVLEELELLSAAGPPSHDLLQVVLAGRPSLSDKLQEPRLEVLQQRLTPVPELEPLSPVDTGGYIDFHLRIAGYDATTALFTPEAVARVAAVTDGRPHCIDAICRRALALGSASKARHITRQIVEEAILRPEPDRLPLSPALGPLLRSLSGGLNVAFEIFSSDLSPLLPATEDQTVAELRQTVASGENEAVRRALAGSPDGGARQRIKTSALIIDLRTIQDGLRTVGLLATATPAVGDTTRAERQMDVTSEAVQRLLSADLQTARADSERERQDTGWLHLLAYLPGLASEGELLDLFLQALAISHDLDARIFVRELREQFALAARLPGDRTEGPAQFPSELIERQWPVRISSVAELERLGWYGAPHELTLVPIGPPSEASHVVAIRGILDTRLEFAVLTGCRILGACLDGAAASEAGRLEEQFFQRLLETGVTTDLEMTNLEQLLIDNLARWAGAEHGAFHWAPLPGSHELAADAAGGANRFLVPLNVPGSADALEFSTSSAVPLTVRNVRLARAGTRLFAHWLLGVTQARQILGRKPESGDDATQKDTRAT